MKRKICVLTGTRAEYGLLQPVMNQIKKNPELELQLIVTGMHLSPKFGKSINEIKKDGIKINAQVKMNPKKDDGFSMSQSVGRGIIGISAVLRELKPDILLVLGDRIEPLAGVISAAYMNIPIAHIHGGDISKAGIDESVRHAITKFANIHFAATKKSAERIKKLGEDDCRIFVTGAPALDTILNKAMLSKKEVENRFNIDADKGFLLLVQHSVTTESGDSKKQITETLEAIKSFNMKTIAIYPNSDAGARIIIKKLDEYEKKGFLKTYKNLSHKEYLSLMKYAKVLIGNSSSGIIESSSFKTPVVNIGMRQEERERAKNVIDVGHDRKLIKNAVNVALSESFKKKLKNCRNPYGNGTAGKIISKVLSEIDLDKKLLQKKITY